MGETDTTRLLRSLLYTAMDSPWGIVLSVSNFGLAQQRLYAERRACADPELDELSFRRSPVGDSELWILRNRATSSALRSALSGGST